VTAATEWDGPAERKRVRPALAQSYEALFHEVDMPCFLLILRHNERATADSIAVTDVCIDKLHFWVQVGGTLALEAVYLGGEYI
jgi:erythromycin esterase-like protein